MVHISWILCSDWWTFTMVYVMCFYGKYTYSCSFLHLTFTRFIISFTMLLSILPLSIVNSSIQPRINSMSLFISCDVVSYVLSSVIPTKCTYSIHLIARPLTVVLATIIPSVNPNTLNKVIDKLTFI